MYSFNSALGKTLSRCWNYRAFIEKYLTIKGKFRREKLTDISRSRIGQFYRAACSLLRCLQSLSKCSSGNHLACNTLGTREISDEIERYIISKAQDSNYSKEKSSVVSKSTFAAGNTLAKYLNTKYANFRISVHFTQRCRYNTFSQISRSGCMQCPNRKRKRLLRFLKKRKM